MRENGAKGTRGREKPRNRGYAFPLVDKRFSGSDRESMVASLRNVARNLVFFRRRLSIPNEQIIDESSTRASAGESSPASAASAFDYPIPGSTLTIAPLGCEPSATSFPSFGKSPCAYIFLPFVFLILHTPVCPIPISYK